MLVIVAISLGFVAARFFAFDGDGVWRWVSSVLWLVVLIYPVGQIIGAPTRIEISDAGMTWHGVGWRRSTPWTAFTEIGTHRHELGAGGTWLAGRLDGGARPSAWLYPRRLVTTALTGTDVVSGLVRLTQRSWWPGRPGRRKPRKTEPAWDVPDDLIVDAVRTRAGDRWVGDIPPGPPAPR